MNGRPKRRPTLPGRSPPPLPGEAAKKRAKRRICVEFAAAVKEPALKEKVAAAWARQELLEHEAVTLDPAPFPHCVIPGFIPNEDFLEELRRELLRLDFHEKCNDLYKFKQSDDLKKRGGPYIAALRKVLFEEFRSWLSDVIQVELEPTIDLSCAKYEYTGKDWTALCLGCQSCEPVKVGERNAVNRNAGRRSGLGRGQDRHRPGWHVTPRIIPVWFQMPCCVTTMSWRVVESRSSFTWCPPGAEATGAPWISSAQMVGIRCFGGFESPPATARPPFSLSACKKKQQLLCIKLFGLRIPDGCAYDVWGPFSPAGHSQPLQMAKSLVPSWNSLAFFEVSPVSFHQVSEVISKEKCRLSVSGWFHGPSVARPPRHIEPRLPRSPHVPRDHEILCDWINPVYLDMDSQAQIQEEFEDRSEILLKDFLKSDQYQLVCKALENEGLGWSSRGPPNKRRYEKAEEESLPVPLKECLDLFRSEAFFLLLSNFTGLKLHFLAPEDEEEGGGGGGGEASESSQGPSGQEEAGNADCAEAPGSISENEDNQENGVPVCAGELRRWRKGCYTLIHDAQRAEFALDLLLFCGCEDWDIQSGGFTSYIAKGEDEELLTVNPEANCLALVYRDRETLKFVKYINQRCLEQPDRKEFWDFSFVYYE